MYRIDWKWFYRSASMRTMACSLVFFLSGCITIPEYPVVPQITFNNVYFSDEPQIDYIYLSINYKDGDGDLGLNSSDLLVPPFTETIDSAGVQVRNPNHYNIFPVLLRKVGESYVPVTVANYDGIFPRLKEGNTKGPIDGTIQYRLGSFNFFGEDSSVAKIRVYIQDRALNKSNVIETPPFPVVYR